MNQNTREMREREEKEKNALIMRFFHQSWLARIKNSVKGCTFVTHVKRGSGENEEYFIRMHVKNDNGGIDKITYKLSKNPNELENEDYASLLSMLKEKEYEQGSKEVLSGTEG